MVNVVKDFVIPAAYSLLPEKMASDNATAMLLAIGLQESRFLHRKQLNGPARGFWQFEQGGGCWGVLTHSKSLPHLVKVFGSLSYPVLTVGQLYTAIENNDILAAVCARLLLWTDPAPLPDDKSPEVAWELYKRVWRPGKPHLSTWDGFYTQAWNLVRNNEHGE